MAISHVSAKWFAQHLLKWFQVQGRHDLPWKKPHCPYRIWVSEIMLQQTQVATAIPYFERFMDAFPNIQQLANAHLDKVLKLWAGLGYYARARHLHKTAQMVVTHYQGKLPNDLTSLQTLPGIGRSTAGAILAQAFNQYAPILDGNVKRVLCRFHCIAGHPYEKNIEQQLWELASFYTPKKTPADYTQAIMDLGATCCTRSQPKCEQCPLKTRCQAFLQQVQASYPIKKAKKRIPTRHIFMALVKNSAGDILLEQRPLKGIWAGLWSFPEFDTTDNMDTFLGKTLKLKQFTTQPLAVLAHTFTHFHLHINPIMITLSPRSSAIKLASPFAWVSSEGLMKRGLPAPVKKLATMALR